MTTRRIPEGGLAGRQKWWNARHGQTTDQRLTKTMHPLPKKKARPPEKKTHEGGAAGRTDLFQRQRGLDQPKR